MNYETMPFGKYKGVFINDIPSNYLIHSLESFDLPELLKDQLKEEVYKRIGLEPKSIKSDTFYHTINLINDGSANTIESEILPTSDSYFLHEYGVYKMGYDNCANRQIGSRYNDLYLQLLKLGLDVWLNKDGFLEVIDNVGNYFNYAEYNYSGLEMKDLLIGHVVEMHSKDFYCEWVNSSSIQISYLR